jgi:molybdopterin-containing oxidoreductase family membrane subunit
MSPELESSLQSVAKLGAMLMTVIAFFTCWKVISGVSGMPPGKYEAMQSILTGPYAVNFWIGEMMLGLVIPFCIILAVKAKNLTALFIASMSSIIGIFFMRYDLVVVGMIVPQFHEMGIVGQPHLWSYTPSLHEIMVVVGGMALAVTAFLMGERLFRGHLSEDH